MKRSRIENLLHGLLSLLYLTSGIAWGAVSDLIADYDWEPQSPQVTVSQGIGIVRQDLLFVDYYRDGVTSRVSDSEVAYEIALFDWYQPREVNPYDLLLTEQAEERHSGSTFHWQVRDDFRVKAGQINSQRGLSGALKGGLEENRTESNSWNLSTEKSWYRRQVVTSLEYAHSLQSSHVASSRSAEPLPGTALDARMTLMSGEHWRVAGLDFWESHIQYRNTEDTFYSPANLNLPRGCELTRFSLRAGKSIWDIELESQREKFEQSQYLGQTQAQQHRNGGRLTLRPKIPLPFNSSVQGRYFHVERAQSATLNERDELGLLLTFSKDLWNLDFDFQTADLSDLSGERADDERESFETVALVRSGLQLRKDLRVQADISRRELLGKGHEQVRQSNDFYGLEARWHPRKTFQLMMRYQLNQFTDGPQGLPDTFRSTYQTGAAELQWRAMEANRYRPNIDLKLNGQFGELENSLFDESDLQWSAHLAVDIVWGT